MPRRGDAFLISAIKPGYRHPNVSGCREIPARLEGALQLQLALQGFLLFQFRNFATFFVEYPL